MTGAESPPTHPDASASSENLYEQLIEEHKSIPEELRNRILDRDDHRCQVKGCLGTERGGTARLLVLPRDTSPTQCDRHDPENLETRCGRCSLWIAQMPSRDDLEPVLRDRLNGVEIEPTWAEILEYLANHGPAPTGEITEAVSLSSTVGVRRALYSLMGIDTRESSVTNRIVVKNRVTDEYGLPWQVPEKQRARGTLPHTPTERRARILDEIVRRLYEHLPDDIDHPREIVAAIVDRDPHQTYYMQQRAEAFRFPFEKWADTRRPKSDTVAVLEAVDVLAGATQNVSPQLLSRAIGKVFERNDESTLAELLDAHAEGNDLQRVAVEGPESDQPSADERYTGSGRQPSRSASPDNVADSATESEQNSETDEIATTGATEYISSDTHDSDPESHDEPGDWICSYWGD